MDRKSIVLQSIDINEGAGLELGPLFSPLVSKDEANISYLDHVSTDDLKKKYREHPIKANPIPIDDIVEVDYVLKDNNLRRTVKGKQFDYIIASHVVEHIPDLVTWFKDVASILNEGGTLALVIPDKRFTFDILRNESRPADVIGAYLDKHTRASSGTMYDYMNSFRHDIVPMDVWQNPYADYGKKRKNSKEKVYDVCLQNIQPGNYVDAHCFVLTPYSFFEILRSLVKHDLFDYEVSFFKDTPENQLEFYVSLRKAQGINQAKKLRSIPKLPKPLEKRELEQEIIKLRSRLEEAERLKAELHHVTSSKSWRATKPMRSAAKLRKKFTRRS